MVSRSESVLTVQCLDMNSTSLYRIDSVDRLGLPFVSIPMDRTGLCESEVYGKGLTPSLPWRSVVIKKGRGKWPDLVYSTGGAALIVSERLHEIILKSRRWERMQSAPIGIEGKAEAEIGKYWLWWATPPWLEFEDVLNLQEAVYKTAGAKKVIYSVSKHVFIRGMVPNYDIFPVGHRWFAHQDLLDRLVAAKITGYRITPVELS